MDLRQTFATNLRRMRHAKGLSQEALAHEAGVNRTYLGNLERGIQYVGLEIIGKLAVVLEVEPAEFLKQPSPRPAKKRYRGARQR
jgi:transcriptional regulator with XRE-family HTH domain